MVGVGRVDYQRWPAAGLVSLLMMLRGADETAWRRGAAVLR